MRSEKKQDADKRYAKEACKVCGTLISKKGMGEYLEKNCKDQY